MKISILTVFPELYDSFINTSLISKAVKNNIIEFNFIRFSDICAPKERIDEPTVGPGVGMVLKPEVVQKAIEQAESKWGKGFKVFFSPKGEKLNQTVLHSLASQIKNDAVKEQDHTGNHLILVCCRYEGQDARVIEHYANKVLSIGDYVLMGGDLPAQVLLEGLLRLIPGVVGKQQSVEEDSFTDAFLDYPHYGLPVEWEGKNIPEVLRSGNHAAIKKWREEAAARDTVLQRFDWFRRRATKKDYNLAKKFIPSHYIAFMHTDIVIKGGRVGNSSITSIDIHDIARSGSTYGVEKTFVVSALKDQHEIMNMFLKFWKSPEGERYNPNRYEAISRITPAESFDETVKKIEELEGKKPIIIATSAKLHDERKTIDYYSQGRVWSEERPVLLVFGTGQGLSDGFLEKCDYILCPVNGMTDFNHLSVRSAAAIVLDRWMGVNEEKV